MQFFKPLYLAANNAAGVSTNLEGLTIANSIATNLRSRNGTGATKAALASTVTKLNLPLILLLVFALGSITSH